MSKGISVVINTLNEEKNIERAIKSVEWADEIVVCDMYSDDRTVEIAKRLGARVFYHKRVGYVEPARNYAISEAKSEWILILDADEEIPSKLSEKLQEIAYGENPPDYIEIPRKNIIFNKGIEHSGWWPDFNIRFFKKGVVTWQDAIHSKPKISGIGLKLPEEEKIAIIHHNYRSVDQFVRRISSYSIVQSKELLESGYKFNKLDLVYRPVNEFLSRFFTREGYKDGLHGFVLSLLQAISLFLVYLNIWEKEGFTQDQFSLQEVKKFSKRTRHDFNYWLNLSMLPKNPFKRVIQRIVNKLI